MVINDNREILVRERYDLAVIGGGIAGISAAVSAARMGAKVILIEKGIVLGGLATVGLISWYEPLCDGNGTKMVGGIAEELIQLAIKYGLDNLPEEWKNGTGQPKSPKRYATRFSPTIFAMALDEYLLNNQVTLTLDSLATFPVMKNNICKGVVVESKSGKEFYEAKMVIDATGDAEVLHKAGVPTVEGENYLSYVGHCTDIVAINSFLENNNMHYLRKWFFEGSNLSGNGHPVGLKTFKGVSAEEITEFVLLGRRLLFDKIKNTEKNSREVLTLPTMPQFRTIRRIVGEYELTGEDLFKKFDNSIGMVGDFRSVGKQYEIPYTCLYNKSFDNLLAAGRIISASGDGWEVTRVIPAAAVTGQAAGTAAAICLSDKISVSQINMDKLRSKLRNDNVLI